LRTGRLTLTLPLVAATTLAPATEWISEKLSKRGIILKRIAATLGLHHLGSRNVNDLRQ
jgi:predicted PurR-regulated permease PerM